MPVSFSCQQTEPLRIACLGFSLLSSNFTLAAEYVSSVDKFPLHPTFFRVIKSQRMRLSRYMGCKGYIIMYRTSAQNFMGEMAY
jgi:hypothetical protein